MFRIGNYPGASGEGEGGGFKVFTFLKEISHSQILVVFYELSLLKSAFVADIKFVQQCLTQSKVSTSLPQMVQG